MTNTPEIERQERLQVTAADGTTHRFYTHDEVQAAIAAAMMGAADIADNTGTCLLPCGHFLSERCGNAIRAAIPTDTMAALVAIRRQVWNEALEQAAQIVDPAPNARSGRWAENIRRKAAAIRAMKQGGE
jgi:hypothetical protein